MESKTILLIFVFKTFSFFYLKNQLSSNCFNLPYETMWTRDTWISQDTVVITNILFIFLDLTLLSIFLFSFFFFKTRLDRNLEESVHRTIMRKERIMIRSWIVSFQFREKSKFTISSQRLLSTEADVPTLIISSEQGHVWL